MPYLCGLWRFANAYEIFKNREEIINIYERKFSEALQRAN